MESLPETAARWRLEILFCLLLGIGLSVLADGPARPAPAGAAFSKVPEIEGYASWPWVREPFTVEPWMAVLCDHPPFVGHPGTPDWGATVPETTWIRVYANAAAGELPKIYIGKGDPVGPRLDQHHSKKDFWTWLVWFTSKDGGLNKAHVQHLEARLIELAHEAKRSFLDNATRPKLPSLAEAEKADAESFLADMLSIFPLVGLSVFEKPRAPRRKRDLLVLSAKGVTSRGYESADGFVVVKGSQAVKKEVRSIHRYLSTHRQELIEQAVLTDAGEHLELTQDYEFNSPSTAAGVMLGRSANGRIEWKDRKGRTLRELQEASGVAGAV